MAHVMEVPLVTPSGAVMAPLPPNEGARLEALRGYAVLDTAPELSFDDLTQLAAQMCNTPVALISLVDADRQWFKSRRGLDLSETTREVGFCPHAILQPGPFIVQDAAEDVRFRCNPLVTGKAGIRFYAGIPLVNPQGLVLGTVCVVDYVPRQLTVEQIRTLEALARQVISQLELRRMNHQQQDLIEELRSSNERFDVLRRATTDVIWDWDLRTGLIAWNPRIGEVLGYSREEVDGNFDWWTRGCHPEDQERVGQSMRRALEEGASHWTDEYRFRRANGTWLRVLNRSAILRDAQGEPLRVIGVGVDLSEREEMRERLALADRMASVGTLAAGVAHEINNPLAYVMANLDFALQESLELEPSETTGELSQSIREARDGAERIRHIVRDLKTLAGRRTSGWTGWTSAGPWTRRRRWRGTRSATARGW